jgi:hypothetical protein
MTIQSTHTNRKYFDEWAKDKSPLLAVTALAFAGNAENCLDFLQMLKSGELIENILYLPPIDQWLNLYRNHRKLHKGITGAIRALGSKMSEIVDFYEFILEGFNQVKRMTPEEMRSEIEKRSPEELQQTMDDVRETTRKLEAGIMALYRDDDFEIMSVDQNEEKKRARKFIHTPEIIFYFRVWIPCFVLYGTYPPYLLQKARHGDDDAIEKLLRLDKSVIDDPRIKEIFHQSAVSKKRSKFDLMSKAIQKAPKIRIEIQTVKYTLAGFISVASIALGQRLTAVEIHGLFDAIARDSGKGIIDDDLVVSPETFEKAIQRARQFWQVFPTKADKK